jgi:hypothetical protein
VADLSKVALEIYQELYNASQVDRMKYWSFYDVQFHNIYYISTLPYIEVDFLKSMVIHFAVQTFEDVDLYTR